MNGTVDTELSEVENISENITETEAEFCEMYVRLKELVLKLSSKRKLMAKVLSEKVETELATLMMPQTKFQVELETICAGDNTDTYLKVDNMAITETGVDQSTFMIAPNVGETLKPLANIASGGELSRVVLALMAILAKTTSVETAVFDEVDAGSVEVLPKLLAKNCFPSPIIIRLFVSRIYRRLRNLLIIITGYQSGWSMAELRPPLLS